MLAYPLFFVTALVFFPRKRNRAASCYIWSSDSLFGRHFYSFRAGLLPISLFFSLPTRVSPIHSSLVPLSLFSSLIALFLSLPSRTSPASFSHVGLYHVLFIVNTLPLTGSSLSLQWYPGYCDVPLIVISHWTYSAATIIPVICIAHARTC